MTAVTITPGFDCALRLYSETPGGFHLLSKHDSMIDAKAAKRAAESVPSMLAAIFGDKHLTDTADALRKQFRGE